MQLSFAKLAVKALREMKPQNLQHRKLCVSPIRKTDLRTASRTNNRQMRGRVVERSGLLQVIMIKGRKKRQRDGKEKKNEVTARGLGELGAVRNDSGTRGGVHRQVCGIFVQYMYYSFYSLLGIVLLIKAP